MFDNRFDRCYDMGMNSNQYMNDGTYDNETMTDPNTYGTGNVEMGGCKMDPIVEKGHEKCVHRTICHEVEQYCPLM